MGQTYQELSDVVKEDLMKLKEFGKHHLTDVELQNWFYEKNRKIQKDMKGCFLIHLFLGN